MNQATPPTAAITTNTKINTINVNNAFSLPNLTLLIKISLYAFCHRILGRINLYKIGGAFMERNKEVNQETEKLENEQSTVEKQMEEVRNNQTVKSEKIRFKHADKLYD